MRLSELTARLSDGGIENADGEARRLFLFCSGLSPWELIGRDPDCADSRLPALLSRRLLHEPLQYLLGEVDFYRERYEVSPAVLIPRSDTELLVDFAVKNLPHNAQFADLCTGSGCIAVSVLANRPDCTAVGIDNSPAALEIARRNALRNRVADRVEFHCADVLEALDFPEFDAVLCNPPYIAADVISGLSPEVLFEPRAALDGGEDGLVFYRSLLSRARVLVSPGGLLVLEIGFDQKDAVEHLAKAAGLSATVKNDLGGNPRLAIIRIP